MLINLKYTDQMQILQTLLKLLYFTLEQNEFLKLLNRFVLTPYYLLRDMSIAKTRLFKYIENFTAKNWKFSDKNSDIFHISAQNIDCGYSLEPPRLGGSNKYQQPIFEQK